MGLALFDRKTFKAIKSITNSSFSILFLFDGYLTESTSFPQFQGLTCLTGKSEIKPCQTLKPYPQRVSLFDGYLIEPPFLTQTSYVAK